MGSHGGYALTFAIVIGAPAPIEEGARPSRGSADFAAW